MRRVLSLLLALCLIVSLPTTAVAAVKPAAKQRMAPKSTTPYTVGTVVDGLLIEEYDVQYYTLTLEQPSKVTVELTTYSPDIGFYECVDNWVYPEYYGPVWPKTFKFTYYLDDGSHDFGVYSWYINPHDETANKFRLKMTAVSLRLDEAHTEGGGQLVIAQSRTIKGAITQDDDLDVIMLKLDQPKQVKFEFTNSLLNCYFSVNSASIWVSGYNSKAKLSKPRKSSFTAQLREGEHYICILQGWDKNDVRLTDRYYPYKLKLTISDPVAPVKLPKTITAGAGSNTSRVVPYTNVRNHLEDLVKYSIPDSGAAIATVSENGYITANAKGSTKLTATPDYGKAATATLKVIDNKFSRKRPLSAKAKALYVSAKKMEYRAGEVHIELFVLNKTGRTITDISSFLLGLYAPTSSHNGTVHGALRYLPDGTATYPIPKGKYIVLPLIIPASEPGRVLDLVGTFGVRPYMEELQGYTEGTAGPVRKGAAKTFKVTMLNSGDKGVFTDKKAKRAPAVGTNKAWTPKN